MICNNNFIKILVLKLLKQTTIEMLQKKTVIFERLTFKSYLIEFLFTKLA